MTVWSEALMRHFTFDDETYDEVDCEVRISNKELVVTYHDDPGVVQWEGTEVEPGHFRLSRRGGGGTATLHRFDGRNELEGSWVEDGYTGMWCIELITKKTRGAAATEQPVED